MSYFKHNSDLLSNQPFNASSDDLAESMAYDQVFYTLSHWLDGKENYEAMREALNNLEMLYPRNSYVPKFCEMFDTLRFFDDYDHRRECGHRFMNEIKKWL